MIKELTAKEFDLFASKHPLRSYHQTSNYANLMKKHGYNADYIGYLENNVLVAASLILVKKISFFTSYGYAPKGFLMDYFNDDLIINFKEELIKYYKLKNVAFIRINPEISIGEIDYTDKFVTNYNSNKDIISRLERIGFKKVLANQAFESILPRFNAIVKTKEYNVDKLKNPTKNNINKSLRKGLTLVKADYEDISVLYEFIKNKKNRPLNYYQDYYNAFKDNCDIFLVKINYDLYLLNIRHLYELELKHNQEITDLLHNSNNDRNLQLKMQSDQLVDIYKQEIIDATNGAASNSFVTIAGAMTIKFDNRVNIIISGYDKNYKNYVPNYFLHNEIIEHYKNDFKFIELNGITGNKDDDKYKGLNEFKLGFKPHAYEFIGEFDLIVDELSYKGLDFFGNLKKEFKK